MQKLVLAFFLIFAISETTGAAELSVPRRSMHARHHILVGLGSAERLIELGYPRRRLYVVEGGRLVPTRYACWRWTSPEHLRLVAMDTGPCVFTTYRDSNAQPIRFIEHRY